MNLKYEPCWEPLHISAKQLFLPGENVEHAGHDVSEGPAHHVGVVREASVHHLAYGLVLRVAGLDFTAYGLRFGVYGRRFRV